MPYNCTGPFVPISVNDDITGYGVVANYVTTAGFAVLLIILYLLMLYDPSQDPFRKTHQGPSHPSFRPNLIDTVFLRVLWRIPKYLIGARRVRFSTGAERSFIKCILAMSDLQIITGISILVSGFAQLRQGLSSYHWMIIVHLAWFSSLTHLACLALLRNHLYNHPLQRMWRLFSMGMLAILLVVGTSFTGSYEWASVPANLFGTSYFFSDDILAAVADPAICHLDPVGGDSLQYLSMVLSIIFIVFGFLSRIIKLFKIFSVNIFGRVRAWISAGVRHLLRITYSWCCLGRSPKSLKRTLLYRPLLTVFLIVELTLDGWSSLLLEVGWLVVGFVWGTIRLSQVLDIQNTLYRAQGHWETAALENSGEKDSDWGFGQVVAIFLLIAPLITIVDHLAHDDTYIFRIEVNTDSSTSTSLPLGDQLTRVVNPPPMHESSKDPDDPDNDWDSYSSTISAATFYIIFLSLVVLGYAAANVIKEGPFNFSSSSGSLLIRNLMLFGAPITTGFIGIIGVVLFSFTIEITLFKVPSHYQKILHVVNILFFSFSAFLSWIEWNVASGDVNQIEAFVKLNTWSFLISAAAFYILFAVTYRIFG